MDYEGIALDDQSEHIHLAHLSTRILVGVYMFAGLVALSAVIYIAERRRAKSKEAQPMVFPDPKSIMPEKPFTLHIFLCFSSNWKNLYCLRKM